MNQNRYMTEREFNAAWTGCIGRFKPTGKVSSKKNKREHYRKHVIRKRGWGKKISLRAYVRRATKHMNCVAEHMLEFTDLQHGYVIKVNSLTSELGMACPHTGMIVTFFVLANPQHIPYKVKTGKWGPPMSMYPEISTSILTQAYISLPNGRFFV